jgi:hypothetical protein
VQYIDAATLLADPLCTCTGRVHSLECVQRTRAERAGDGGPRAAGPTLTAGPVPQRRDGAGVRHRTEVARARAWAAARRRSGFAQADLRRLFRPESAPDSALLRMSARGRASACAGMPLDHRRAGTTVRKSVAEAAARARAEAAAESAARLTAATELLPCTRVRTAMSTGWIPLGSDGARRGARRSGGAGFRRVAGASAAALPTSSTVSVQTGEPRRARGTKI